MKKALVLSLSLTLALSFAGCNKADEKESSAASVEATTTTEESSVEVSEETEAESTEEASSEEVTSEESSEESSEETTEETTEEAGEATVMSYADYMAADYDTEVVVDTFVQAKQSWWDNKATVYTQDEDGAYFLYNMACSEEDYEKLTPGTEIIVKGFKSQWSGEIEIVDATFEIADGNFVAKATDVTEFLGKDELIDYQNQFVSFKDMTVEAAGKDEEGNDVAFLYNYDGSGEDGNDLYFNVSKDGETYTFTVESYLCDNTTDVYAAVKNLEIGQTIDMEGFLYWYEGVNTHVTNVVVK